MSVYLLHFTNPLPNRVSKNGKTVCAGHYIGWSKHVKERVGYHQKKMGSHITKAAVSSGSELVLARVWEGDEYDHEWERRLKRYKKATDLCPICNPDGYKGKMPEKLK